MIKTKYFGSKYVNVLTNIRCWSTTSKRTVFTWADIQQSKSLILRGGTRRPAISKREEQKFRIKVNLKKEEGVEVVLPRTYGVQF
jgi:hypothetical protein